MTIPQFSAIIFRRTYPQIFQENGPWDTSERIYPYAGATASSTRWNFPSGATVTFHHMSNEGDWMNWLGSQVPLICFDQVETFTEKQVFTMLACNRDPHGIVRPYVRATCNPEPDCWLSRFIQWWWDPTTGYAIEERSGCVRWFVRVADTIVWHDDPKVLQRQYPGSVAKSVSFIPAKVEDNKILMDSDPSYLSSLLAQGHVERERWLFGNWKIKASSGMLFMREDFQVRANAPTHLMRRYVRFWDLAATAPDDGSDPDWTAGGLYAWLDGQLWVLDMRRLRATPKGVEDEIKRTAANDPKGTCIRMEEEGGASGKSTISHYARNILSGYDFAGVMPIRRKVRGDCAWANALSSAVANHNVFVLDRPWTNDFIDELVSIPEGAHDDQAITAASAHNVLCGVEPGAFSRVTQPWDRGRVLVDRRVSSGLM